MIFFVVVFTILFLLSIVFSAAETALVSLSEFQIQTLKQEKSRSARFVVKLYNSREKFLGAILIGNNVCNIFSSALVSLIVTHYWGANYVLPAIALLTVLILIFSEIAPKQIALVHNVAIAKTLAQFIYFLSRILSPIIWFVSLFGQLVNALFSGKERQKFALDNLLYLVNVAEKTGEVAPYEKTVIQNIFRLSDLTAASVMTHRKNVFSLKASMTINEAVPIAMKEEYSRIPIYGSSREDVEGIILLRDLYQKHNLGYGDDSLASLKLPPLFIPASMHLNELVKVFERQSLNMAIVLDEYGGLAGVVTREDVLEEILGELYDENEEVEEKTKQLEDLSWLIQGDTPIYWLKEQIGHDFETSKHINTVAGYLIEYLDRLPTRGEVIEIEDLGKFKIEQIADNHIVDIRYYPKEKDEVDEENL